ncbi:hypothetical protein [Aureivirga marina]|uniref:hypothetical protein n=1 Tax=Aureivirga marina TaxID=1182451 RepID=UPI0018CA8B8B|nr:hypothetical protein [Aureivirga marina]
MKKVNKKHYNFTEKQKGRDYRKISRANFPIGKELKIMMNKRFRRQNNVILRNNIVFNEEKPFVKHVKFLSWWVD